MPDDISNYGIAEPEDVLDPRHYEQVRDPAQSRSLPLWCYTSQRFFNAEMQKLFLPGWSLLDRVEKVPNVGDFFTKNFMNIPLLIVRGDDRKVRVFANTCRHRGALVATGEGNCKGFRCPYHAWTYALDGGLIGAPEFEGPDGKPLIDATNKQEFGLVEMECDTWGGFIFVKFEKNDTKLSDQLGDFGERLKSHQLEEMVCVKEMVFNMDANWKYFVENYSDAYHIPTVHRDSLAQWKGIRSPQPEPQGHYRLSLVVHEGSQLLLPGQQGFPAMPQIDPDKAKGTIFTAVHPNMMMTLGNDGALVFNSEPLSPTKSRLTVSLLFPKSTVARNDFQDIVKNYYHRNDMVVGEDVDIALRQQAGIESPYARAGRLGRTETGINAINNWILDQVVGRA